MRTPLRLFLCLFLTGIHISLYSQAEESRPADRVSIKGTYTLKKIFDLIYRQTKQQITYANTLLDDRERVTVDVSGTIDEALTVILAGKAITWVYSEGYVALREKKAAVTVSSLLKNEPLLSIEGTVTDENGKPLLGATIIVKGTNKATATDVEGRFKLGGVLANAKVLIRYMGYSATEVNLDGQRELNVKLRIGDNRLDEAVVVAYGTSTQRTNTGAITVIKGEQIHTLPNQSFDKSLQGLVPGMRISSGTGQPGGGLSNMIVRGISTGTDALGGSTVRNPLIVIDGMQVTQDPFNRLSANETVTPLTNPLAQINPDDIAEITVLKDAAAIALYGSKASNGVILVSTKRGRRGSTRFSLNHQTDASFRPSVFPDMLNQQQYLDLLYETYRNTDSVKWTNNAIRADLFKKFPYQVTGIDTSFYPMQKWAKEIYRHPAITLSNNLSISGGSGNQAYYLNFEYTKQDGIVKQTSYDRASVRVNLDNKVASWLKFAISTLLSYNVQNTGAQSENSITGAPLSDVLSPLLPVKDAAGNYIPTYSWGTVDGRTIPNPVLEMEKNLNKNTAFRGLSSIQTDISFLRHFNFTSMLGIDYMQAETKIKRDPQFKLYGNGTITDYDTRNAGMLWTNSLKYQTQIGLLHGLQILAAQEIQIRSIKNTYLSVKGANNFIDPFYSDVSSPGYALSAYSGNTIKRNTLSQLAHVNYDYNKRYFLTISWRRDGSSVFGDANPFGHYWSLGGAWIVTSEQFMKPLSDIVSFLKLRGSIGIAGNAGAVSALLRYDLLNPGLYLQQPAQVYTLQPGNPNIKWEKTRQWNAGMQMGFIKNRLNVEADLYYKFTKDLIYSTPLPSYTGYTAVMDNIGDIRNSGIEISISGDIIQQKKLNWNLRVNWSRNSNILLKANKKFNAATDLLANEEGREFNSYFLPVWSGVNSATGMPQWVDSSGKPTETYRFAKKEFAGKVQPDGFGSLISNLSWNGLALSLQFYYQYGGFVYNNVYSSLLSDGLSPYQNSPVDALDRWQKPGDIATNPIRKLNNNNRGSQISTRYLQKANYMRFQNARLTWELPRQWINKIQLLQLRIYIQGNNLAVWSLASGVDPDIVNVGGGTAFAYPNARTYSIGINSTF